MFSVDNSVWVLVDLQVKLLRAIHENDALVANTIKLAKGMAALGVPVICTEQNPDGLGPTTGEVAELITRSPITKLSFSCCGEKPFVEALRTMNRRQVIISGIETHVCVYQTTVDLVSGGCEVQVVSDAVSSRTPENKTIGLARMRDAGASITSIECILFELLKVAEGPVFKAILDIVK